MKMAGFEVDLVEVSDFELASRRRTNSGREFRHSCIVKVEAGHGPVRLRRRGFFNDLDRAASLVEGNHAIAFRIAHLVGEDRGAARAGCGGAEQC